MSVLRIAARYAKSLIDLAQEQGKLDRVLEDMQHFRESVKVRELYLLLKSPIVQVGKKQKIFMILFADIYDPMSYNFLKIILRKGREEYLPEICDEFIKQYHVIRKISTMHLVTAKPLDESQLEAIREQIRKSGLTFPNIQLETEVDEELIGGFVLKMGDKLYDASIAFQLEQLRNKLTSQKT